MAWSHHIFFHSKTTTIQEKKETEKENLRTYLCSPEKLGQRQSHHIYILCHRPSGALLDWSPHHAMHHQNAFTLLLVLARTNGPVSRTKPKLELWTYFTHFSRVVYVINMYVGTISHRPHSTQVYVWALKKSVYTPYDHPTTHPAYTYIHT